VEWNSRLQKKLMLNFEGWISYNIIMEHVQIRVFKKKKLWACSDDICRWWYTENYQTEHRFVLTLFAVLVLEAAARVV